MSDATCSLCHLPMEADETVTRCPACAATAHAECWQENGGCGAYGCREAPAEAHQAGVETPTWWGREHKTCPGCGREIKAAALRCRYCQAVFETAAPLTPEAYRESLGRGDDRQAVKVWARLLFFGGFLPCLAPVVLVAGIAHAVARREALQAAPPIDKLLHRLGRAMAAAWIGIGLLVWALSAWSGA